MLSLMPRLDMACIDEFAKVNLSCIIFLAAPSWVWDWSCTLSLGLLRIDVMIFLVPFLMESSRGFCSLIFGRTRLVASLEFGFWLAPVSMSAFWGSSVFCLIYGLLFFLSIYLYWFVSLCWYNDMSSSTGCWLWLELKSSGRADCFSANFDWSLSAESNWWSSRD